MPDGPNKKDIWDRVTALATILVPAAIALAGHFIAQGLKQAEISSAEERAAQSRAIAEADTKIAQAIAEANTKIAQASLINTLMKSLTSSDPRERKLAVEAVLIALPEQGPILVRTIAQNDEDETVQAAATNSLEQRASALIRDLFAEEAGVRIAAAQELVQGWRSESNVVPELIHFAAQNRDNTNGVYNTVVVLYEFSPSALQVHKQELFEFLELAKGTGPRTEAKATMLERRLGG